MKLKLWQKNVLSMLIIVVGVSLFYLYKTKRPWLYYFAILFVAAVARFISLSELEI